MAIVFINITVCSLCNSELKESEKIYSFPAFAANAGDPMFEYNDQAFHLDCLKDDSQGQKAIKLAEKFLFHTRTANRICVVSGNRIMNPNDYLFIPLLTSNAKEKMYDFNFLTFDRSNTKDWERRQEFLSVAKQFRDDGKWIDLGSYKYLDSLLNEYR